MPIPFYAGSMIRNYRAMFLSSQQREFRGSDEQIWEICNTVYDDDGFQDEARVLEMLETEPVKDNP